MVAMPEGVHPTRSPIRLPWRVGIRRLLASRAPAAPAVQEPRLPLLTNWSEVEEMFDGFAGRSVR
jgi:hypothetical protein